MLNFHVSKKMKVIQLSQCWWSNVENYKPMGHLYQLRTDKVTTCKQSETKLCGYWEILYVSPIHWHLDIPCCMHSCLGLQHLGEKQLASPCKQMRFHYKQSKVEQYPFVVVMWAQNWAIINSKELQCHTWVSGQQFFKWPKCRTYSERTVHYLIGA